MFLDVNQEIHKVLVQGRVQSVRRSARSIKQSQSAVTHVKMSHVIKNSQAGTMTGVLRMNAKCFQSSSMFKEFFLFSEGLNRSKELKSK